MHLDRQTRTAYLAMVSCVVAAGILRLLTFPGVYDPRLILLDSLCLNIARLACYSCFLFTWMRLVRSRFILPEVRRRLVAIALLLLLWLLVQTIKYEFASDEATSRLLWYAYYAPILLVPPLLFEGMLYVGKDARWRADRRWALLYVAAAVLLALVLTNDLHQLVFRFSIPLGQSADYSVVENHTKMPLWLVVWAWAAVWALAAMGVLVLRCTRGGLRRRAVPPLAVLALIVAVLPMYGASWHRLLERFYHFPDMTTTLVVAFMESLVVAGLLPVNAGHEDLWRASSLRGGFVDAAGTLAYVSEGVPTLDAGQVALALENPVQLEGDLVLASRRVSGGSVFWVRDLTRVRALRDSLEELGDALAHERSLLEAENDLAHSRESLVRRQEVYDRVIANTTEHLERLESALSAMPEDDEAFLREMHRAALYAAYIKRCANLTLLGEGGTVDARELALSLGESATALERLGMGARVDLADGGTLVADDAIQVYRTFEDVVEEGLSEAGPIDVSGERWGDAYVLLLDAGGQRREVSCRCVLPGGDEA